MYAIYICHIYAIYHMYSYVGSIIYNPNTPYHQIVPIMRLIYVDFAKAQPLMATCHQRCKTSNGGPPSYPSVGLSASL